MSTDALPAAPAAANGRKSGNRRNSSGSGGKKNSVSSGGSSSGMEYADLVPAGLARVGRDGGPAVTPTYTKVGESFRHRVPGEMQCSMFCGGRQCKYESRDKWKPNQMAVDGVFSHWVTDNLVAMARPNTALIERGGLIDTFKRLGIRSIVNLQTPGEHASCGPKLHKSGFTYDPNDFMKNDIFFYNYAMKDFSDAPMTSLLDMVKVLSFALSEGCVAVHCHAGLGRTGVLIACYLVYYLRVRSNDALRYLRHKRPGSVQTRKQIECVKEFEAFFLPQCLVFSLKPPHDPDRKLGRFTIDQFIKRQRFVVHGYEARTLKYIPKIMLRICERLLKLSGCQELYGEEDSQDDNFTRTFVAYRFDSKGSKLLNFKDGLMSAPTESMAATRRSSQSLMLGGDDETLAASATSSSGLSSYGNTRPNSETNSYVQSCSSALSGVDDKRLDEILGDGIQNQPISENRVTKELQSHADLKKAAMEEKLPVCSGDDIFKAMMEPHGEILRAEEGSWATADSKLIRQYRTEMNFKLSAWDRIETETNLFVLSALLFEWMEHLKAPILDKDGITYVVIYCDNIDQALKRLPNHVCFIVEYIARFVARLQPLRPKQTEALLLRMIASLTHQGIVIDGVAHPAGKKFTKLRGGTTESTKKFMMRLLELAKQRPSDQGYQLASMNSGFNSLDASASSSMTTNHQHLQRQRQQPSLTSNSSSPVLKNLDQSDASRSAEEAISASSSSHSVNALIHQPPKSSTSINRRQRSAVAAVSARSSRRQSAIADNGEVCNTDINYDEIDELDV